jgi:ubiquinone/menaquinone biosynthesis C-methylase UbiE
MSDVMRYDGAPARRVAALGDTAEMADQRRRVIELLAPREGWRVLDVGCGPGHLAMELADAVGPRGRVCGVDVSDEMLALAARRDLELVRVADTALPFEDGSFDAAVATQVYEFVADLPGALAELLRVLRPGGRALILDTDWDSVVWHSSDRERMEQVLDGWRARVADPCLPRSLSRRLREAGFELLDRSTYAILDVEGREHSYSARQIEHLGASALDVAPEQVRAWAEDLRALARSGDYFFSVNRYLFLVGKPRY